MARTSAESVRRVGFDQVSTIDTSAEALVSNEGTGWHWPDDERVRTPGQRLLFALSLTPADRRAFVAFHLLAQASSRPVLVIDAGVVFRSYPAELLGAVEGLGLVLPRRVVTAAMDHMEPWIGSLGEDGTENWSVIAAGPRGAQICADAREGILTGWGHGDFHRATRYREAMAAIMPGFAIDCPTVVEPAYLGDEDDLPGSCAVVVVPHYDPSRPFTPDGRFLRPRVTTLGRPALERFLLEELDACDWPEVRRGGVSDPDAPMRRVVRSLVRSSPAGVPAARLETTADLVGWLREPADRAHVGIVSRGLFFYWLSRADLQSRYPDPLGADELGFLMWALEFGTSEDPALEDAIAEAVVPWLAAPVDDGRSTGVSRALLLCWAHREDLRRAYPDPLGADAGGLEEWGRGRGVAEHCLTLAMVGGAPASGAKRRGVLSRLRIPRVPILDSAEALAKISRFGQSPRPQEAVATAQGVLVLGHFPTMNGLGGVARSIVDELDVAGVDVSTRVWETGSRSSVAWLRDPGVARRTAIAVLGAETNLALRMPRDYLAAERRAGLVYWEIDSDVPGVDDWNAVCTELWAPSAFVRDIVARGSARPIHVAPQRGRFVQQLVGEAPAHEADRDAPYLLFCFDFYSIAARKNPVGVVRAFRAAFGQEDGVRLVIKALNSDGARGDHAELIHAIGGRRDVEVVTDDFDDEQLDALMRRASAYVSLHRSEGFGLTLAEAMASGVPVIATAYGGNLDFTDDATAWMVPYDLVEAGERAYPYPAEARWAEPSVEVAAAHLRRVLDGGGEVERRRAAGFEVLQRQYGGTVFADFLRERDFV